MLEDFCNSLSDQAQLKIALRFAKLAMTVWEKHFDENPDAIKKLNGLIGESNHIQGGAKNIDVKFPIRAIEKIERSYKKLKSSGKYPISLMKSDGTLSPIFKTATQPLTNSEWDDAFPYTVRLCFTLVWNILSWVLFKRKNEANETHIYVACNQAVDVLISEKILRINEIEGILNEHKNDLRSEKEEIAWEKAPQVEEHERLSTEEVYKKIIGENIIKDASGSELAKEILRQMKEEDKSYWDEWEEYYSGTCKTYSYNKEKKSFWRIEADVIAASFFDEYSMTEREMQDFISGVSLNDLRQSGFEI